MPLIVEPLAAPIGASIGAWIKAQTIAVAERALRAEVGRGFDSSPVVVTDGVPRRDPAQVKPFGRIEFARRTSVAEAVLWALAELRQRSPVGPAIRGHYRDDHVVMVNGAQILGDARAALMALQPTDRVQIVNPRPYARKIEGATANKKTGRGKRKALSRQARGGVYRVVIRLLEARFGRVMFFDYKMVPLNTGVKVWGDQGGRYRRNGSRAYVKRVQRNQVYPALQFYQKPTDVRN
jgi:hypothetical protein